MKFRVGRTVSLPDPARLLRYRTAPAVGPRVLFLSGGSALAELSTKLVEYTHQSIHLVTPFDSGGSSAELRRAFDMIAIGDVRNRLMALADRTSRGHPDIYSLFATRLPRDESSAQLRDRLELMVHRRDPLIAGIPDPMRKIIRVHLRYFLDHMPATFDLRGASIGNLILAGGYLNNGRHLDPVIFVFSKLVEVHGLVRPVVSANLHLAAELANGRQVVGQHRLTGKEAAPLESPVRRIWLCKGVNDPTPDSASIRKKVRVLFEDADLICLPMGSFYSSLACNLLPEGVGRAIADRDCPKVYIPNTGRDPEQLGTAVADRVEILLDLMRRDAGVNAPADRLMTAVVVDLASGDYGEPVDVDRIARLGVATIDVPLVTVPPLLDADRLLGILLSLA